MGTVVLGTALISACESSKIALVSESNNESADFGRTALIDAVVTLSKSPESPQAYAAFVGRVEELTPLFNREVKLEAELRTCVLAIAPLQAGLDAPQSEQMERFATTVWPALLKFPTRDNESATDYVARLCATELAVVCNNVVPEQWPVILNARVWRTLKSRVGVAYDRCRWCADDPSFTEILSVSRAAHLKVEMLAKEAHEVGRPSAWPKAGKNASPLATDFIVSFGGDGWVTIKDRSTPGGNWRQAIETLRDSNEVLGLHFGPARQVGEFLQVLADVDRAGYESVALVTRKRAFPYDAMQYLLRADTKSYRSLGVHNSDTIQILVQALDLQALKQAGKHLE